MTTKPKQGADKLTRVFLGLAVVGVGALLALNFFSNKGTQQTVPAEDQAPPDSPEATSAVASDASDESAVAFHRLEGRWLRPDGGYVLDLRWVGADGRVEAGYFNPQPIFVSRAEASEDDNGIKVMVELQDRGYPGCVYTLHYDPVRDVLVGEYYQAAMRETFPVAFERTESP